MHRADRKKTAERPFDFDVGKRLLEIGTQSDLLGTVINRAFYLVQKEFPPTCASVPPQIQPASQVGTTVNGDVERHCRFRCIVRGKFQLQGEIVYKHVYDVSTVLPTSTSGRKRSSSLSQTLPSRLLASDMLGPPVSNFRRE